MRKLLQSLLVFSACAFGVSSIATEAFADCSSMGDAEWTELSTMMASSFNADDYEGALNYGKRLTLICPRSPIVNYTMSEIYRKMNNEAEAATYAKKATDYISDYPVQQVLAERIWMRRAEYELPYKGELQALQAKTADYDEVKASYEALLGAASESRLRQEYEARDLESKINDQLEKKRSSWKGALWSGVSIGVVGIALGVTGGVLTLTDDKVDYKRTDDKDKSGFSINKSYVTGYALLGAGVATAVAGVTLASVAGYYLNHMKVDTNGDGEENETISFNVSPAAVQFGMTF